MSTLLRSFSSYKIHAHGCVATERVYRDCELCKHDVTRGIRAQMQCETKHWASLRRQDLETLSITTKGRLARDCYYLFWSYTTWNVGPESTQDDNRCVACLDVPSPLINV